MSNGLQLNSESFNPSGPLTVRRALVETMLHYLSGLDGHKQVRYVAMECGDVVR